MKRASVYRRRKQFLIHSSSQTEDGVWVACPPFLSVPESGGDPELEHAIRDALRRSESNVPRVREWSRVIKPLLDLAGVKSWSALVKGATLVEVIDDGAQIVIIPMTSLGADDGFQEDITRRTSIDAGTALGQPVRELLSAAPGSREHSRDAAR